MRTKKEDSQMTDAAINKTDATRNDREAESSENAVAAKIIVVILLALVAWGLCIFFWGIPGLYIPAVALVPVIWIALITITLGQ